MTKLTARTLYRFLLPCLLGPLGGFSQTPIASINVQEIDLSGIHKQKYLLVQQQLNTDLFKIRLKPLPDDKIVTAIFLAGNEVPFDSAKSYSLGDMAFILLRVTATNAVTNAGPDILEVKFIREADNGDQLKRNSSFIAASFVKSIAGSNIPSNELLDIFIKVNLGTQKKWFALMGADAGLGASSQPDSPSSKNNSRLNEAMANINYAVFRKKHLKLPWKCDDIFKEKIKDPAKQEAQSATDYMNKFDEANKAYNACMEKRDSLSQVNSRFFDNRLSRTAFAGFGLKVFYKEAYIGGHFGIMETNGDVFGSYILCGFYHNMYAGQLSKDSAVFNYYSNNIYLEAGVNIFGGGNKNTNLSSFFNSVRLKFGLLLPMKTNRDQLAPQSKDILSRLAIEIPLGIKRF
ncbi:MAG: hypothetical protein JO301_07135 [Chitinophagaceae bacterium]|nr:hypothetical protein [Chitinophagaceae bacterium]